MFPFWGRRDFVSIRRKDINDLLDNIVKTTGAWNADHVLAITRKIADWYATRDDDYVSPFVKGMRRTKSEKRERYRVLDDEELRLIWKQAEANGTFGALIQILLLTAQRRGAVVRMKWSDITPVRRLGNCDRRARERQRRCAEIARSGVGDHPVAAAPRQQSLSCSLPRAVLGL